MGSGWRPPRSRARGRPTELLIRVQTDALRVLSDNLRYVSEDDPRPWAKWHPALTVLTGDLDVDPGFPSRRASCSGPRWWTPSTSPGTHPVGELHRLGAADRRRQGIDQVLVGQDVGVRWTEIVDRSPDDRRPSDHLPVLVDPDLCSG